ncbi:HAMP domain-containing sensor histidine kinase [Flammeovirgaceae bacterium SG7u.111]|nr:HAMP domain-containing sensor histidine kinase [Flammeovirgaceae bacterium SG7u.132]WPO34229.1 HAMP domain-containing sensor histidine kinase [Flammeovirgaceae bacterium SG7u.111]
MILHESVKSQPSFWAMFSSAKDRENELIREIKSLNKALELFTYSTSHDLRAPITTMMGLVNLIDREEDVKNVKLYTQMMRKSLEKQDFFLQNISELLKIARLEVTKSKIDLHSLIEETFDHLSYLDGAHEVEKTIDIKNSHPVVISDRVRLWVMLNNLLSNAIKFQRVDSGKKKIEVEVIVTKKRVKIIICDNGIGIEPEHQDKVFDMFYRATDYNTGSGLGLYIVKETLSSLDGKITITSKKNKGTCVEVQVSNLV